MVFYLVWFDCSHILSTLIFYNTGPEQLKVTKPVCHGEGDGGVLGPMTKIQTFHLCLSSVTSSSPLFCCLHHIKFKGSAVQGHAGGNITVKKYNGPPCRHGDSFFRREGRHQRSRHIRGRKWAVGKLMSLLCPYWHHSVISILE